MSVAASAGASPLLSLTGAPQFAGQLQDIPGGASLASLFDQAVPQVVYLLDESGGFSDFDTFKYSSNGDSWVWNRWYLDGVEISDPMFPGAPALAVPMHSLHAISVYDAGFAGPLGRRGTELFLDLPRSARGNAVGAEATAGQVGDIFPPAHALMDWTSGSHSRDRNLRPSSLRRRFEGAYDVYGTALARGARADWGQAVRLQFAERRFPVADPVVDPQALRPLILDDVGERIRRLSVALRAQPERGRATWTLLAETLGRERYGAELFRGPDETARLDTIAVAPQVVFDDVALGLLYKRYRIEPRQLDFSREFHDPDGQSLEPWQPDGTYDAVAASLQFERRLVYVTGWQSLIVFRPERRAWSNPLTLLGARYGHFDWRSEPALLSLGDIRVGLASTISPRRFVFDYNAYIAGSYAFNDGGANQLGFADVGLRLRFDFPRSGGWTPFVLIAKTPIALDSRVGWFLHPNYMNGELWLDRDGGTLIDTQGGRSLDIGGQMRSPNVYGLATGFEKRWSEAWSLLLQGLGKAYKNTFDVEFDRGPDVYGSEVDGVYYFDSGPKAYVLTNRETTPVYYGLQLQALGQRQDRYLFSWSFAAYNAIGRSPFGNGPEANDIGVVSFSSVNPNSWAKGNANLDVDRAFNTKILAGTPVFRGLWWYATLTHYDGTPFAPYRIDEFDGQPARTYQEYRGSPYTFVGPLKGRREDYRLNLDVKLQYSLMLARTTLKAWWAMSNLLDFGNEIVELQTQAGVGGRLALEQEIPRAFAFGVEVSEIGR